MRGDGHNRPSPPALWGKVLNHVKRLLRKPGERGQSVLEFALMAPFIFLFLFVIVDFGTALDRRITLQHAVREGARITAVEVDPAAGIDATVDQAQGLVDAADVSVCFIDQDGSGAPNTMEPVRVSLTFDYKYTVPFGSLLSALNIPSSFKIAMDPSATAALENDPEPGVTFTECP